MPRLKHSLAAATWPLRRSSSPYCSHVRSLLGSAAVALWYSSAASYSRRAHDLMSEWWPSRLGRRSAAARYWLQSHAVNMSMTAFDARLKAVLGGCQVSPLALQPLDICGPLMRGVLLPCVCRAAPHTDAGPQAIAQM